ncbi:MAG: hypothetical protein AAF378_07395 [Cyanobacteria bacterium P01_A01_bin.84]
MSKYSFHYKNFIKVFHKFQYFLNFLWVKVLDSLPFLVALAVLLSVISIKSPFLVLCLLLSSLVVVVVQQIGKKISLPKKWLIVVQCLVVGAILSAFWLDYFAAPAQAQFFRKAEDFFKNTLTQDVTEGEGTQAAVSLVFNVLRALYLLYIAVALIGVVNAVRKDEDWQSIARTPLLVVVAVTIADVLTGFVIGDSGGNN